MFVHFIVISRLKFPIYSLLLKYCKMITIRVNDQILEIQKESNLLQLLQKLQISEDGIAIAINETIVLKSRWNTTTLSNNDTLLIIEATQGG